MLNLDLNTEEMQNMCQLTIFNRYMLIIVPETERMGKEVVY